MLKDFFVLSILLSLITLGLNEPFHWGALIVSSVIGTVLLKLIKNRGMM